MATKDWKLEQKNKVYISYRNYPKQEIIVINKNVFKKEKNYGGWVVLRFATKKRTTRKQFETKLEGIAFAKAYMRKH